uniref:tetratricopeptide repeat protein n=1 Tax=Mesonia mobilis TaxID=369791 RepID=UPI003D2EA6BD
MRKTLLASTILLSSLYTFSQEKVEYIDTEEIITEGFVLAEEGNVDEALELFNKVNKNDSLYHALSVTKSYFLLNNDKNDEAIDVLNEALHSDYYEDRASFYVNKTNALSNKGEYEKAIKTVNNGLKFYPRNASLWHNKGLVL